MRLRAVHILLLLAAVAGLTGCGRRARVIPEKKMSRIYAEMFLADQWVRDNADARAIADTTLFFDPIFERYGYDFEDFDRSVNYYLDHPIEYADLLSEASDRLRSQSESLQAALDADREREAELDSYRRLYHPRDFSTDSLRWSGPETLWPVWTGPAEADSLAEEPRVEPERKVPVPDNLDSWQDIKPVERLDRPRPARRIHIEESGPDDLKKE